MLRGEYWIQGVGEEWETTAILEGDVIIIERFFSGRFLTVSVQRKGRKLKVDRPSRAVMDDKILVRGVSLESLELERELDEQLTQQGLCCRFKDEDSGSPCEPVILMYEVCERWF